MAGFKEQAKGNGLTGLDEQPHGRGVHCHVSGEVLPLYMEDYTIARVVQSLDERSGVASASLREVRSWLNKGLQTNMVILAPGESKVSRGEDGRPVVAVNYERRVKFLYNIDLVLTFEHDWKVKSQ